MQTCHYFHSLSIYQIFGMCWGEQRWIARDFYINTCTEEQRRKCIAISDLKNSTEMCNKYAKKTSQKDWHVILTSEISGVYQDKILEEQGIPDKGSSMSKGPEAWKYPVQELQISLKWPKAPQRQWPVMRPEGWEGAGLGRALQKK